MPRELHTLMHPRTARQAWTKARWRQANAVLDFVRERGVVHPREVDAHFAHGKATNWFGGSSNASTQLLDGMHYRGLLRIARREGGVRLYAPREAHVAPADPAATMDTLVDIIVNKYAPLPERTLSQLVLLLVATEYRTGATRGSPRWRARKRVCRMRLSMVTPGTGRKVKARVRAATS